MLFEPVGFNSLLDLFTNGSQLHWISKQLSFFFMETNLLNLSHIVYYLFILLKIH